jgi:predicted kinase
VPKLILTVGLPRSGKSTWARQQGHPVVNPDSVRLAVTGQRFVKEAETAVWMIVKYMVTSLFLAGHETVILDATSTTHARRDQFLSKDWDAYVKVFDTHRDVCAQRALATNQADLLPIIDQMADAWEDPSEAWTRC